MSTWSITRGLLLPLAGTGLLAWSALATAAELASCEPVVGRLSSVEGRIEVQRDPDPVWRRAALGASLCERDTVRSGRTSRAAISLVNDAVLRVDEGTTLRLLSVTGEVQEPSLLALLSGAIKSFSRRPRLMQVNTPYLNGTIEGTEFLVRVAEATAAITVLEGRVRAANDAGTTVVQAGEEVRAGAGTPPTARTLVRPRDAVQWTLYYPPVLVAVETRSMPSRPDAASAVLADALVHVERGDPEAALDVFERVPAAARDARFHLHRAAIVLALGQAGAAAEDLERAIALESGLAEAYALRSVIRLVQNRGAEALADADRAVTLRDSAATRIAQSYARQAAFDLEGARDTLQAAVDVDPDNALAWARLGELWLMLGERERALDAARRGTELAPGLGRAHLVLGFAALATSDYRAAHDAFARAAERAPADPLARLGVGLARIAAGRLSDGRRDIELAVALDANSALLRAYLGKAYFEEAREPLARDQYRLARELDPLDPTAYLYSAILHQTTNRPIDALYDLAASIERNDNRAVYRSRLLLDKDRAARGTSLARIHADLGFDTLGVNEATRSLASDPTDASAHRFLSDAYRALPRHEVARVSELLQSQMLQDVNLNPVQPSVASTNLNIVTAGGPGTTGFNEFTPLFEQNRGQVAVSGFAGSNHTRGAEAVASAVVGNLSLSAGGFSFETDGFRPNNDLQHTIAGAYAQVALTPSLNLQAEARFRETDHGDLDMTFDPDASRPEFREGSETTTVRAGLRFSPSPRSTLLLSAIRSNVERSQADRTSLPPTGEITRAAVTSRAAAEDDASQYELLYAFRGRRADLIAGAAYARVEREGTLDSVLEFTFDPAPRTFCASIIPPNPTVEVPNGTAVCAGFPFLIGPIVVDLPPFDDTAPQSFPLDLTTDDHRAYGYGSFALGRDVDLTLGLGYASFENEFIDFSRWSPKAGVRWRPTSALELRAAYFRTVKPALASNRTLEPSQVGGFNQLFDDADGTRSSRYGLGVDWQLSGGLYAGAEYSRRFIDWPVINTTLRTGTFEERDERQHRVYLSWTPSRRWAVAAEAVYDRFENRAGVERERVPRELRTASFPLTVSYFHPSGVFANAGATYVRQDVERDPISTLAQGRSRFVVADVSLGYRLAKRRGLLSVSVHNVLDRRMRYQDDGFRTFQDEPSPSPFTPERTLMGRVMLSFD